MNILDYYKQHCEKLKSEIEKKSNDKINELIITVIKFYFGFEQFNNIVNKHIHIDICQEKFLDDLKNNKLNSYRVSNKKALEEINKIDEYTDEYEEIEEMELRILSGFTYSIEENRKFALFHLFDEIITILDYYEQFSERPEYWNKILEIELSNQLELLKQSTVNINFYKEKYNEIKFEKI